MPKQSFRAAGCVAVLMLGVAGCAPVTSTALHTHGEIPRDSYGQPVWAEIGASTPHPDHGPIYVPAGPPIRTVQGAPAHVASLTN